MIKYGHSIYQWYPLISTSFSSESAAYHVTCVNSEKKTVCFKNPKTARISDNFSVFMYVL